LNVSISVEEYDTIRRAAEIKGLSMTRYVVLCCVPRAQQIIRKAADEPT
jgi:uncharacterized protein (DUF1778 family)